MHRCITCLTRCLNWRRDRKGAATVELAIVLPMLLMLVFGGLEIGRAVMVKHILEEAARAGCRVATMENATTQDVNDIVDQAMQNAKITGYVTTISPNPPSSAALMDAVTVTVSVPHSQVSIFSSPRFMGGSTLAGTCVMLAEGDPSTSGGGKKGGGKKGSKKGSTKK